jgi:PmbA protein
LISVTELKAAAADALAVVEKMPDVKEAEIFLSAADYYVMRICHATNVRSNALEEPKSNSDSGLGARVLFNDGRVGFGRVECSFGSEAAQRAYAKAKRNRVYDRDFRSMPAQAEKPLAKGFSDSRTFSLSDDKAVDLAYECLSGALDTISKSRVSENLNITGELDFGMERVAVANTNSLLESDEATNSCASLTTILESDTDVSGMWLDTTPCAGRLAVYDTGRVSAEKALSLRNGSRVPSGSYDVVFGSIAFADLLQNLFTADLAAVEHKATPYADSLGKSIAAGCVTICDDGNHPHGVASRRVTDEGLATGRTELVKDGILTDFLSNDYYSKKFSGMKKFLPRNGFRHAGYNSEASVQATNVVVSSGSHSAGELISEVKNGLYIGRVWYSYPVNGFASADFTSTVRGDSYIIEDGKLKSPLVPNTLRMNDNFTRILQNITAVGKESKQVVTWGEDSVVITPEVAVKDIRLNAIASGLYQ